MWKDDKVLLVCRGKPPRAGQWSIPGGAQELGETHRQTAIREVREEAGIEIELTRLVDVIDFIEKDDAGRVLYHYTLVDWAAEWRDGDAEPRDDVAAVRWVHPDALDDYDIWSETKRVIRRSAAERSSPG